MSDFYYGCLIRPEIDPEAIVPVDFRNGTRLQMKFKVTFRKDGDDYIDLDEPINANVSYFLDPDSEWYNVNVLKLAKKGWNGSVTSGEIEFDKKLYEEGCQLERKEKDGHVNWSFAGNQNVISDSKAKSMEDQIAAIIAGQKSAEPAPKAPEPKAPVFAKKGSPRTAPPAPPARTKLEPEPDEEIDPLQVVWAKWTEFYNGEPNAEEWNKILDEIETRDDIEADQFTDENWKEVIARGKQLTDKDPV